LGSQRENWTVVSGKIGIHLPDQLINTVLKPRRIVNFGDDFPGWRRKERSIHCHYELPAERLSKIAPDIDSQFVLKVCYDIRRHCPAKTEYFVKNSSGIFRDDRCQTVSLRRNEFQCSHRRGRCEP